MKRFAAICALLFIQGKNPHPLSPAVVLFIIYGFDLRCLTPSFIGEWFADLRSLIFQWLEMGPNGDLSPFASHFASYHDTEVS